MQTRNSKNTKTGVNNSSEPSKLLVGQTNADERRGRRGRRRGRVLRGKGAGK